MTSRYNNTDTLSGWGWVPGSSTTDLAVGIGTRSNFDVPLVVKNLTNSLAHEPGWVSYAPNPYPRWFGLVFSGKL